MSPISIFSINLDQESAAAQDYRSLLGAYVCERLKLNGGKEDDRILIDRVIAKGETRFAFVSFIVERFVRGHLRKTDIEALETGTGIYRAWLADLDNDYGVKRADALRHILAMLLAAEEAHDWMFKRGKLTDPADGSTLTPLATETFEGVSVEVLAELCGFYDPDAAYSADRFDPYFVLNLQELQGALSISRSGDGQSKYRIALKAFRETAHQDEKLNELVSRSQLEMASQILDAADSLVAIEGKYEARNWDMFTALVPYLEAVIVSCNSEPLRKRFAETDIVGLAQTREEQQSDRGLALTRIAWLDLVLLYYIRPLTETYQNWPAGQADAVASVLQNRGLAKADGGDISGAIVDYNAAIEIRESFRTGMVENWPIPFRNDLATSYLNRGTAKAKDGDLSGAMSDYIAAIEIREQLRASMGQDWPLHYRNDLAKTYSNRGTAWAEDGHFSGALDDFNKAIDIMEGLGARMGEGWPILFRNDLAYCYQNRGAVKAECGDLSGAIHDFDTAIEIQESLRTTMGAEWPIIFRKDMADGHLNRAQAKRLGEDLSGALKDHNVAIEIQESLRAAMGENWPLPYRNDLATSYQHRGSDKVVYGDLAGAISDYSTAIEIREKLRANMEKDWSIPLQNDLATNYSDRGIARRRENDLVGAIADINAATEIQEHLRAALGEHWPIPFRNDYANTYVNRANAKLQGNDISGALADYTVAIEIREGLCLALGQQWPTPFRYALAANYLSRAISSFIAGRLLKALRDAARAGAIYVAAHFFPWIGKTKS